MIHSIYSGRREGKEVRGISVDICKCLGCKLIIRRAHKNQLSVLSSFLTYKGYCLLNRVTLWEACIDQLSVRSADFTRDGDMLCAFT